MPTQQERRSVNQELFKSELKSVVDHLQQMLIEKNKKYGDAALNPNQTFSTASPIELINVRIDDKLSRIRNRQDNEDEDPELDLLGYLILKRIAINRARTERVAHAQPLQPMPCDHAAGGR